MKKTSFVVILCLALLLGACTTPTAPTAEPQPAQPSLVPDTPTAEPTELPATSAPPQVLIGEAGTQHQFIVFQGGYAFTAPLGAYVEISGFQSYISYEEDQADFFLYGSNQSQSLDDAAVLAQALLQTWLQDVGTAEVASQSKVELSGGEATLVEFNGSRADLPFWARVVIARPGENRVFALIALSREGTDEQAWQGIPKQRLEETLASIRFIAPEDLEGAAQCPSTENVTYGVTPGNPVKVGGGSLAGPARERAYLDNLTDSGGNPVSYERVGSRETSTGIIDEFKVTMDDNVYPLFLDQYMFDFPMAPQGFFCLGMFPLGQP